MEWKVERGQVMVVLIETRREVEKMEDRRRRKSDMRMKLAANS